MRKETRCSLCDGGSLPTPSLGGSGVMVHAVRLHETSNIITWGLQVWPKGPRLAADTELTGKAAS